jgi:ATP-dependent RNA helicase DHX57
MESLELVWVSQANALQRKGRAGRVMPGVCIHLFTRHRYEYHFLRQPVPELHRVSLEQLILRIKTLRHFADISPHEVLGKLVIASFIISRSGVEGIWPICFVLVCKTVSSPEF